MKPSLTGIILEEPAGFLRKRGTASYRAKQITDWIYKKRVASFDAMTDLPNEFRAELAAEFDAPKTEVVRVLGSKDTTQKFLFRLRDQNLIESVLIPASPALYGQPSDRRTICVSSQVGCAYSSSLSFLILPSYFSPVRRTIFPNAPGSITARCAWAASAKGNSLPITGCSVPFSRPTTSAA